MTAGPTASYDRTSRRGRVPLPPAPPDPPSRSNCAGSAEPGFANRLRQRRGQADGERRRRWQRLHASDRPQRSDRVHIFAFPIWTFAVIAGAIWAENSWGRYRGWDPKETWAFITWVLYAAHLHAQATAGWPGARAAWFAFAGYAAFLFNFFGVNLWISGLHSYAGD